MFKAFQRKYELLHVTIQQIKQKYCKGTQEELQGRAAGAYVYANDFDSLPRIGSHPATNSHHKCGTIWPITITAISWITRIKILQHSHFRR